MKKLLSIILTATMLLLIGSTVAYADNESFDVDSELYIETTICPQEYIEYAENNIVGFVESYGEGNLSYSSIFVGTPFSFVDYDSDVYYFPVICDGTIKYILRVYPSNNNSFDAVISDFLAAELESIARYTSITTPLRLNRVGNDIVASIGSNSFILFSYPEEMNPFSSEEISGTSASHSLSTLVVNSKSMADLNVSFDTLSTNATNANSWSYYIALDITETQGSNSWCAAYCTSTILRTLGYSSTAEGIMSIFYRNPKTTDSISRSQVVSYANMRGLYPTQVESTVSYETLRDELRSNRPVYFSMTRTGGNHAVVLRGYNSRYSKWSIWNPWFTTYETFSMGGTYVPTGYSSSTYSYTYARTIYNWA